MTDNYSEQDKVTDFSTPLISHRDSDTKRPVERTVLVVAYYFPPMGLSGVQRTLKFVKYLPEFGWRPIVLTTSPAGFYAFDETLMAELEACNIEVHRTGSSDFTALAGNRQVVPFPSQFKQKLGSAVLQTFLQPDSRRTWLKPAVALGNEILATKKVQAILSTAPPFTDFLVAESLASEWNIPFVVDYRDVWIDNPFHFYATPFHKRYAERLETKILRKTAKAIVTTRHMKELLLKRYRFLRHEDIEIIPQGYDAQDFEQVQESSSQRETSPNRRFVITHSGIFQDDRTPRYFLEAVKVFLEKNPEFRKNFLARFVGVMRKEHLKLISSLKLDDVVEVTGYLSHDLAVKSLIESDVLWLMLRDIVRSPGKLWEYIGSRKPLLVSTPDGVVRRTALDTDCAICTEPDDVGAIARGLEVYFNQWRSNTLPIIAEEFSRQFERRNLTADLARILNVSARL